jgi:Mn2+/Fe2+ NRAMP family transporter
MSEPYHFYDGGKSVSMAGQMIMQGFVGFHIPIAVRRRVTMARAFVV